MHECILPFIRALVALLYQKIIPQNAGIRDILSVFFGYPLSRVGSFAVFHFFQQIVYPITV